MAVLEKKYTDFIDELVAQISPLLPDDVNELQKSYLITNVKKSATKLAESMPDNDEFSRLDFAKQCFYIQIIAEWSFHKEIDLFRSGIPAKYWKVVMQKIWYTMWDVMYACLKNEAPEAATLSIVERYVTRTYNDAVEDLKSQNLIDDETEENAKGQSNIEIMAREYKMEKEVSRNMKLFLYRILLAVLISAVVSFIVLKFKTVGLVVILTTLIVYHFIPTKNGP